ncbi:Os04g0422700 [Oryza sativa Japonica Group]|uniref:Os04g0422700 protein n=1 Tax=Oryza sativa subsp. japonica TaxID=39947 RepID=Q0JD81_ORYSJ|nr:Os04g0422700 [Oryza sativa Japonica Group]|eukprot:NP_001052792.2 Os04g0422700 [Oryza sativa Japonica Group]
MRKDMRGGSALPLLLLLLLCCSLAAVQPARALFHLRGAGAYVEQLRGGGGYGEEKVPMTVVVPDYSPRPAPFGAPAPAPAIPPLPGSDDGGGGDMPTLPSERRSPRGALPGGNAGAEANAGAPSPAPRRQARARPSSAAARRCRSPPASPTPPPSCPCPHPGQEQQQVTNQPTNQTTVHHLFGCQCHLLL